MPFFKYTTDFPFIHECPESEAQFCDISQLNIERKKPSDNSPITPCQFADCRFATCSCDDVPKKCGVYKEVCTAQ